MTRKIVAELCPADLQLMYLQNSIFDPMVVPPLPWTGSYFGGHLLQNDMVIRLKSATTQLECIEQADKEVPGMSKVRLKTSLPVWHALLLVNKNL